MKILVFNVKYSENLGDGLLADCIEETLRAEGGEVETLDLAGRTAVGTSSGIAARTPAMARPGGGPVLP